MKYYKREIDKFGLLLCDLQGQLFEYSIQKENCSSNIFIRRFMNSKIASNIDKLSILHENLTIQNLLDYINDEYGISNYGKVKFSKNEMYWIGYIYRYFSYVFNISSKEAYSIIKGNELRQLYFAYHSLDPINAIERILEAKNIQPNKDFTQEGIKILRRLKETEKDCL